MANLITFQYKNQMGDPIDGLNVTGTIKVGAILNGGASVYTTDSLDNISTSTDGDGFAVVDVEQVLQTDTFIQVYKKFSNQKGYNVSFVIELNTEQQEIDMNQYVGSGNIITLGKWNIFRADGMYQIEDILYYDNESGKSIYLTAKVISKSVLSEYRKNKLDREKSFITALSDYQSEIIAQANLQIDYQTQYNPKNFTQVITRCLELVEGTLNTAITYVEDAGLGVTAGNQILRFNGIRNAIDGLSSLYPDITLEQGEGIPYQSIGVIPTPFRGFGFAQIDYTLFFLSQLTDTNSNNGVGILCDKSVFTVNGSQFELPLCARGKGPTQRFDVNIDVVINHYELTLVSGDILSMTIYVYDYLGNEYTYESKLVIK
jgi:hypothetical protein